MIRAQKTNSSKFIQGTQLRKHMCKEHDAHTKFHLCKFCGFSSHSDQNLREHIAAIHEKLKNVLCPECGDAFNTAKQLRTHFSNEHSLVTYICPQCSKGFKEQHRLYTHLQVHLPFRPFKCTLCNYATNATKRYILKDHLKSQHGVIVEDVTTSKYIETDNAQLEECKALAKAQLKDIIPITMSKV